MWGIINQPIFLSLSVLSRRLRRCCWLSLRSSSAGCRTTLSLCGWSSATFPWMMHPLHFALFLIAWPMETPVSTPFFTLSCLKTSEKPASRSSHAAFFTLLRLWKKWCAFAWRTSPWHIPLLTCDSNILEISALFKNWRYQHCLKTFVVLFLVHGIVHGSHSRKFD